MASGFGFQGGRSRCYADFHEFMQCYREAERPEDCRLQRDDYFECLHHKKEIARAKQVKEELIKRATREAKEQRESGDLRATSSVLRLGLIPQDKDKAKDKSSDGSAEAKTKSEAAPSKDE